MKNTDKDHRYQGHRIDEWLDAKLEGWLGLSINREKTKVVNLDQAESRDFLGFNFRYDRDRYGSDKTYLNVMPSKKSLQKWEGLAGSLTPFCQQAD